MAPIFSKLACSFVLSMAFVSSAFASHNPAGFDHLISKLEHEAKAEGISQHTLDYAFKDVHYLAKIMESTSGQPELRLTTQRYLTEIVTPERIKKGNYYYHQNALLLQRISATYHVQSAYIVAIWGIESSYGQYMGTYPIISSLATLIYNSQRPHLFTEELFAELKMVQQGYNQPEQLLGSWAGATGQCQFMPGTFLDYAVDYDHIGKKDIWHDQPDVFASIANFFSQRHWDDHAIAAIPVTLPKHFNATLIGIHAQPKPLLEWIKMGVQPQNHIWPTSAYAPTRLIQPDGPDTTAYLITDNFKQILAWNNSVSYALAVSQLAHEIALQ